LALVLLGLAGWGAPLAASPEPAVRLVVLANVPLSPWCLDSLRALFLPAWPRLSIIPRLATPGLALEDLATGSYFLVDERDIADQDLRVRLLPTGISLDLVRLLAVDTAALASAGLGIPSDRDSWKATLQTLRELSPDLFPWFEALYSPATLRYLEAPFGPTGPGTAREAIAFLRQALARKWLNPLSLEADETAAFEVLEARDTVFSSLWVPAQTLDLPPDRRPWPPEIRFVPLPGPLAPAEVPHLHLGLYRLTGSGYPGGIASLIPERKALPATTTLAPFSAVEDQAWGRRFFTGHYESILRGEP